ncbi:N-acetylaspartate synthetase-like [Echinops telfairi]|uniref:N-acetylaspartate synthetase-like n=1 Tax=Echinops telfairi TaxID=9371 RepID=A0AC55CV47_ECHTE|nr:N-acetylaspartate synthetase-like [Echinops telfairi]
MGIKWVCKDKCTTDAEGKMLLKGGTALAKASSAKVFAMVREAVELQRMSVDSRFRGKGIAKALGRKVLEFALVHNYSAVVLGTTAVKVAAHKLYESLGFRHMGASDRYVLPGMTHSLPERLFFQVRYHRYRLQLREE